ncbi:hypothetical protein KIW84_032903 [Lathyrus oleraceus]|uniref:Uncharacterized protein n=1 Tax=Pisum sativum TaxID=3888 RepID=A0A9D4XZU8_PEA|nr:hypothetical protein KIW84_032903 [Pisum sativum]
MKKIVVLKACEVRMKWTTIRGKAYGKFRVVIDTRYALNDCDNSPLKNVIDVIVNVVVLTVEIDPDNPMHDSFTHFKHKEVGCNINVYNDATKDGNEDTSEDLNEDGKKKLPKSTPHVPFENVSFNYEESIVKWNFVYHMRITLDKELYAETLKFSEIMELLSEDWLLKMVIHF